MAEARRYGQLKIMERAGEIADLELQPVYPLVVAGIKIGKYIGDFRYVEMRKGAAVARVVEDCKGVRTPVYRLKKKLVEALYPGVKIVEVSA